MRVIAPSLLLVWSSLTGSIATSQRQLQCYKRETPPAELALHLPQDTFLKAQRYGRDKTRYALYNTLYDQLMGWGMILTDFYPRTWAWTGKWMGILGLAEDQMASHLCREQDLGSDLWNQIFHSLLWITAVSIFTTIPSIPWSLYHAFVLEEKHGFNKSTLKLWISDQLKTYGLLAFIGLPVLSAFLKIIDWAGKLFVPWLMLFM